MKKLAMALLGVMLLGAAQLTAGPRVVFMGDSITRLWGSNRGSWFTENNFVCKVMMVKQPAICCNDSKRT